MKASTILAAVVAAIGGILGTASIVKNGRCVDIPDDTDIDNAESEGEAIEFDAAVDDTENKEDEDKA